MTRIEIKNWGFAFILTSPILIFFGAYLLNHPANLIPTGFIQYDNPSYIAYAKQYLDSDWFHLQYSNPFNDHATTPIYFQPQTLFFAILLKFGLPPGWILIPFTIFCSIICFRLLIAIYDLLAKKDNFRTLSIWLFGWGGGVLMIGSVFTHYLLHKNNGLASDLFLLDPEHGWWGLNLGRSLLFSCEAYYHALFLGCIYCILREKWIVGCLLLLALAFSQPFSGLELLAIVGLWIFIEFILRRNTVPTSFALICLGILILYVYYYFVYLNQFPDHRSVARQYSLNWRLGFYRILPAYCFVGLLALVAIYKETFLKFFQIRENRLFACWFIMAFLLANHEWFVKPKQPIHFTRGYIWTSLFLLGLPALQQVNAYLKRRFGTIGFIVLASLFFLDNFSWIFLHITSRAIQPTSTHISYEQKEVFRLLNNECTNRTLLVSNDGVISYLSTVYSKAYPWLSHPFTTPFAGDKAIALDAFVQKGQINPSWMGRNIAFVLRKNDASAAMMTALGKMNIAGKTETANYIILKCDSLYVEK